MIALKPPGPYERTEPFQVFQYLGSSVEPQIILEGCQREKVNQPGEKSNPKNDKDVCPPQSSHTNPSEQSR